MELEGMPSWSGRTMPWSRPAPDCSGPRRIVCLGPWVVGHSAEALSERVGCVWCVSLSLIVIVKDLAAARGPPFPCDEAGKAEIFWERAPRWPG